MVKYRITPFRLSLSGLKKRGLILTPFSAPFLSLSSLEKCGLTPLPTPFLGLSFIASILKFIELIH